MGFRPCKDPGPREPCTKQYNDPDVICILPPRLLLGRFGLSFSLRYGPALTCEPRPAGRWRPPPARDSVERPPPHSKPALSEPDPGPFLRPGGYAVTAPANDCRSLQRRRHGLWSGSVRSDRRGGLVVLWRQSRAATVRWRPFIRVAGRGSLPPARRPRVARARAVGPFLRPAGPLARVV